jgi:flavodoxin
MKITETVKAFFSKHKELLKTKGIEVKFTEDQKMTTATLVDGTEISTPSETWAEGVDVLGADGQPLPTGEYQIGSGETLIVTDGKLTSILPAGSTETEMTAEEIAEGLEVVAAEQAATIEAMTEEKQNLEADIAAKTTEIQNMSKQIADLQAKVTMLSKLPAAHSSRKERAEKEEPTKTKGQEIIERLERKQQVFGSHKEA